MQFYKYANLTCKIIFPRVDVPLTYKDRHMAFYEKSKMLPHCLWGNDWIKGGTQWLS
jgi:hypothetical protein